MIPFPLHGDDSKPDSPLSKIIQGAANKPIVLTQAPTTINRLVPEGELGIFNNDLYHTSGGVTRKYTGILV